MLWILLALMGAAANAGYYIAAKRLLATIDRNVLAAGSFSITGIFLLTLALARGIPDTGSALFMAVAVTTVLNIIATTLVFRTLSTTDISLAVPMIAFTPIFLIATSFVLLGELPTLFGVAGICAIVTGSYILNLSQAHTSLFDPFRAILKNNGTGSMLIVAFLYAITVNFDKMVVLNSDPVFGSALVCLSLGVSFFAISLAPPVPCLQRAFTCTKSVPPLRATHILQPYYTGAVVFAGLGILLVIESVSINVAYTLQIVPYVIAIKRMSIIITVLYGTMVAGEREVYPRLAGALMMVAGAVMIILSA